MVCAASWAGPVWVVDPGNPGPDAPREGRSLFDQMTTEDGRQRIPYPFETLLERLNQRLDASNAYLGQPLKKVLIPLGRSLQREAAAPGFFSSPRLVVAVDAEPRTSETDGGMLLRDRLYIGYLEAADVLEIISYNEAAARFEFQVVRDYRSGGVPRVRYARRVVCMACHQNAAPIFARPLWDETNANEDVARQLEAVQGEFHGVPARLGVDVAYAIDNATDRANDFALTQTLWREGCGNAADGGGCRQALLIRALQFALGGRRGYDRSSVDYDRLLRRVMAREGRSRWPDGLLLSDPNIPNRKPLHGSGLSHFDDSPEASRTRADVSAQFEPLTARAAAMTWSPDPDGRVERAVSGLTEFFARADIERIDRRLAQASAAESTLSAECDTRREDAPGQVRIKLACRGQGLALSGLIYRFDTDMKLSGRLRGVQIAGEDLGALRVGGHETGDGALAITLARPDASTLPRLANGDALAGLTLSWTGTGYHRAVLSVHIRHDFGLLRDAVEQLAKREPRLFASAPFRRAQLMPALFEMLGMAQQAWCCTRAQNGPPIQTAVADPAPDDPQLRPFFQVCGACHRSDEPFPPNFLAGTARQARSTLGHCAERIQYRLAMWDLGPDQRAKSPMPPQHADSMDHAHLEQWLTGLLPELRRALGEIAADDAEPLPSRREATARPYSTLRRCLPAS